MRATTFAGLATATMVNVLSSSDNNSLFTPWFESEECSVDSVEVLKERSDGRAEVFDSLVEVAADHVVGLKAIEKLGGFPKAKHLLKNRVPTTKIGRSGMLGEILATEYVAQETEFSVPVRRLRHRDTRELAMRGDDVLGFRVAKKRVKVLKVEAKSRVKLATATLEEARTGLSQHRGRPNPETLAFLECHLRMDDRDAEAEPIAFLQKNPIYVKDVCHLLFTLSENSPKKFLVDNSNVVHKGIELRLCGCRVKKHADFVKAVFDQCLARG